MNTPARCVHCGRPTNNPPECEFCWNTRHAVEDVPWTVHFLLSKLRENPALDAAALHVLEAIADERSMFDRWGGGAQRVRTSTTSACCSGPY